MAFPTTARRMALAALMVAAAGCSGSDGRSPTAPEPAVPGMSIASTDAAGIAALASASGDTLLLTQAFDDQGNPLDDIEIFYWQTSPDPIVAFTVSGSGDPSGFFYVEHAATIATEGVEETGAVNAGVFILSRLDPTLSRLFDPKQDGFNPAFETTLHRVREVIGAEALYTAIRTAPGIEDREVKTKRELSSQLAGPVQVARAMREREPDVERFVLRNVNFVTFTENQHDEYRYRVFAVDDIGGQRRFFLVPLGLSIGAQITFPVGGTRFTDEEDRRQVALGIVHPDAASVQPDHGRLELQLNGEIVSDLSFEEQTDRGIWRSLGFDFAEGDNTLQLRAFVEEVNAGIETPLDGLVSTHAVSVEFAPNGSPPVLSNLTFDPTAACPDGELAMAYHFEDPDADALTWHLVVAWDFGGGDRDSTSFPIPVHASGGECMRGAVGNCDLTVFAFEGFDGGETVTARVWVEDAAGHESNILIADYTVTGDCTARRASAEARRFSVYPRGR